MDLLNDLMGILKEAPQLAIWIFLIIYGFKVVVVGSIYGVIRFVVDRISLAIERRADSARDMALNENGIYLTKVYLSDTKTKAWKLLVNEKCLERFYALMDEMKNTTRISGWSSDYIHEADLEFVSAAIKEKKERDSK